MHRRGQSRLGEALGAERPLPRATPCCSCSDSFRDWHFEVVNEATKDGNKEIAELKKQTAHEEVLKAQQEALQARQRALQEQESIKPLVEQKNALRGEIEALQTEKEVLTAAEVEAIKGEE